MNTTELIKKVRRVELKTRHLSAQLFAGDYQSAFKGKGMSFSEVRQYQYGDDVRTIDWNVTARTDDTYVRVYEEERELTLMVLVDVSKSMYFASSEESKIGFVTELAAVLSFSALQNNDKVGLILFSNEIEMYIPAKKGKKHILRIIRSLLNYEPKSEKTDIGVALEYLNNVVKRKAICFLMTDFHSEDYNKAMRISAKRHDLIAAMIHDDFELGNMKSGLLRVIDAESGNPSFLEMNAKTKTNLKKRLTDHKTKHVKACKKMGVDCLEMTVGKPYSQVLHNYFKNRAARR